MALEARASSLLSKLYSLATNSTKERIEFLGSLKQQNEQDHDEFDTCAQWQKDDCGKFLRDEWCPDVPVLAESLKWIGFQRFDKKTIRCLVPIALDKDVGAYSVIVEMVNDVWRYFNTVHIVHWAEERSQWGVSKEEAEALFKFKERTQDEDGQSGSENDYWDQFVSSDSESVKEKDKDMPNNDNCRDGDNDDDAAYWNKYNSTTKKEPKVQPESISMINANEVLPNDLIRIQIAPANGAEAVRQHIETSLESLASLAQSFGISASDFVGMASAATTTTTTTKRNNNE